MPYTAVDPADGRETLSVPDLTADELERAVAAAHAAATGWRSSPFAERSGAMRRAAGILRARADEFGRVMAREMGKPLAQGVGEAEKCAWVCDYYADHAEAFLRSVEAPTDARRSYWSYEPIGLVLAVMPWNFPFWQVIRFAAPTLMAGNGGLLKHASNVPGCARAIEAVFREAGFPPDLFRNLYADREGVAALIEDPRVRAVTLTGSVGAGRAVAAQAGRALKKTVLELGGSDPYVVLEDADLDRTVEACVTSRLINSGQSCIAAKRFIVVEPLHDAFVESMVARMGAKVVGHPLEDGTEVGPQARVDLRDELHDQVERSLAAGARAALGGEVPDRPGAWYPPTVLVDVRPGMSAYEEELFGPVAAVIRARDEEDAIRIANDTSFGLGAAVFTADRERGERIARERLDAGACFVNAFVRSDPRLPFGGVKESGYGRELSPLGIREFVNAKAVWVD
jgi:succinate-semialdehyde dehydrogenase / glutarate-semialdehyde dehydrogenase